MKKNEDKWRQMKMKWRRMKMKWRRFVFFFRFFCCVWLFVKQNIKLLIYNKYVLLDNLKTHPVTIQLLKHIVLRYYIYASRSRCGCVFCCCQCVSALPSKHSSPSQQPRHLHRDAPHLWGRWRSCQKIKHPNSHDTCPAAHRTYRAGGTDAAASTAVSIAFL